MDRQYNDQKKHGQTIQRPKETWTDNMFLLVVVFSVHVSFGRCIVCPCFFWSLYCLSMFLLVLEAIQRPKETWSDNTTTKRNMDRQYNDQKKHGQTILSFGRCIVCPCFFWSLYCLSMFLLVVVLSVHVSFGRCIVDQKKHGQTIQRPKEIWTDNTTAKRNMDRQYNDRIACPCFVWSLYCLSMFLLEVALSVHVSFGRCIDCPCFFWSLYFLSMFRLVVVLPVGNTTTKRNMDRQYNDQKKHGQAIQRPKETWTGKLTSPCFFW
jgi:hypothetical protein